MIKRVHGSGFILRFNAPNPASHSSWNLGPIPHLRRFVALYRHEPFWMRPRYGNTESEIPADVQWLLAELDDNSFVLYAPLIDGPFRASLHGSESGMVLHIDSGDPAVVASDFDAVYVTEGIDPHAMAIKGAQDVALHLKIPLRDQKSVPAFANDFGWCTWDAFYRDVTPGGVLDGLRSLREGGVTPGFIILDDGWLSTRTGKEKKEEILTSFGANDAFDGDLSQVIAAAKGEFGVRTFLVWHAVNGYWGGADQKSFASYQVRPVVRRFAPGILAGHSSQQWWADGTFQGPVPEGIGVTWVVPPSSIASFYNDFHRSLRSQGVDGLKVDNQAALEGLGEGSGGRVELMQRYREALEGSAHAHFSGNLINCMSCSTDMLYSARASNIVRSSDDFYPNNPETHGRHVVTNALFGMWFGQFVLADWDMFHSSHPAGSFHAAARALSGGPIYVSDKPGHHDFELIRRLLLNGSQVSRTLAPAVPTADSLLSNVLAGESCFKVFAPNASNWIVGAFHCHFGKEGKIVTGTISSEDIPALKGESVIAYVDGRIERGPVSVELEPLEHRLITLARVEKGFAAIGLTRLLNPGSGMGSVWQDGRSIFLTVYAGGEFLAYSESQPARVEIQTPDGWIELPLDWDSGALKVQIPENVADVKVAFRWAQD